MKTFSEIKINCRICLAGKSRGQLISPCNCKGSLGKVHSHCMQRWLEMKESDKCEICNTKLNVKKVNKNFNDWTKSKDNRNRHCLVMDLVAFVIVSPMTCYSLYLCLSGVINYSQPKWDDTALVVLFLFLVMSFSLWIMLCIEHHWNAYHRWSRTHYRIVIMSRNESETTLDCEQTNDPEMGRERESVMSLVSRFRSYLDIAQPFNNNAVQSN